MVMQIERLEVPMFTDDDGVIRVAETRVALDSVVYAFDSGATAEEIAQQFPSLSLTSVYAVIAYYLGHRYAVQSYLAERAAADAHAREVVETDPANAELRTRLLARRAALG